MSDLTARRRTRAEGIAQIQREDGRVLDLRMDDTLAGWWQVVKWNWTHPGLDRKHKRKLLLNNAKTLFTHVLWRKIRSIGR